MILTKKLGLMTSQGQVAGWLAVAAAIAAIFGAIFSGIETVRSPNSPPVPIVEFPRTKQALPTLVIDRPGDGDETGRKVLVEGMTTLPNPLFDISVGDPTGAVTKQTSEVLLTQDGRFVGHAVLGNSAVGRGERFTIYVEAYPSDGTAVGARASVQVRRSE